MELKEIYFGAKILKFMQTGSVQNVHEKVYYEKAARISKSFFTNVIF